MTYIFLPGISLHFQIAELALHAWRPGTGEVLAVASASVADRLALLAGCWTLMSNQHRDVNGDEMLNHLQAG